MAEILFVVILVVDVANGGPAMQGVILSIITPTQTERLGNKKSNLRVPLRPGACLYLVTCDVASRSCERMQAREMLQPYRSRLHHIILSKQFYNLKT